MILNLLPQWAKCGICALNREHNPHPHRPICNLCGCPSNQREWKARLGRWDPRRLRFRP